MAPVATFLAALLALAASSDAAPSTPFAAKFNLEELWRRYYGDSNGLTRPGPLVDKRATLPSGWSTAGCVTESSNQRLLQGFAFHSKSNTPMMCLNECAKRGFTIAGTEYGDECYCAHELSGNGGVTVPDKYCYMPCPGGKGDNCGAAWHLSMYTYNVTVSDLYCKTSPTPAVSLSTSTPLPVPTTPTTTLSTVTPTPTSTTGWAALGCAVDSGGRPLTGFSQANIADLTPESCQKTCTGRGFAYAGVENGDECYCGSSLAGTVKWDSSLCKSPCAGNSAAMCGGMWAMQIYQQGGPSASVASTTQGPSPTTSSIITGPTTVPQSNEPHYVWAHHMVGNTYNYVQSNWASDVNHAKNSGVDGFALNMGGETWESDRVNAAYAAAEAAQFKMFMSFDMTSLGCGSANDANKLVNLVKAHASSSAQAKINGKVLVSTFSGEGCTFGTGSITAWKTLFKDVLANQGISVHFVPAFFVDPSTFASYDWLDGVLNWNSAWPMGDYDIEADKTDSTYLTSLGSKTYMSSVSPFFFTHFGPATWNKNWIYRSDDWLYCSRWEQLIALRGQSTMTEILTWNDYGESSYLGPISGMLPITSNQWVDGFDHSGLEALTNYYATAYKTGKYPTITKDSLVMWSRPHPANADASADSVGRPTNWQWTADNLYAVVLATAPATVVLQSGATKQTFNVPAGLTKLKMPSTVGSIEGSIQRGGAVVAKYASGAAFQYTDKPATYNFNYFVASASG